MCVKFILSILSKRESKFYLPSFSSFSLLPSYFMNTLKESEPGKI